MRESRLFLNFFKNNILILVIAVIIGLGSGYLWNSQKPTIYTHHTLLELNYPDYKMEDRIILADEIVVKLRSENLERTLGLNPNQTTKIFKPAPYAIKVEVTSKENNL